MPVETPYYQSSFSSKEVEQLLRSLNNWAHAGFSTANSDSDTTFDKDTVAISGADYAVVWQVAPTNSNQVYGIGLHKTTGRIYQIYNNRGTLSATALVVRNTAGATNSTSKLYLLGAGTQADNPQRYSNANVYIQNGNIYANNLITSLSGEDTAQSVNDIEYISDITYVAPSTTTATAILSFSGGTGNMIGTRSTTGSGSTARRTLDITHSHIPVTATNTTPVVTSLSGGTLTVDTKYLHTNTVAGDDNSDVVNQANSNALNSNY